MSRPLHARHATDTPPLALAAGDPAGVGPEVTVEAACALAGEGGRAALFGDARALEALLARRPEGARALADGAITLRDVGRVSDDVVARHAPSPEAGALALASLDAAALAVQRGSCAALVTAPVSKRAITLAGTDFVGQTEHLARAAGLRDDDVTMMFLGPALRVSLATTHLALRDVPAALTAPRVERAARHLGEALARLGAPDGARVLVCGLNPHAGEDGLFGDEEPRVLAPALAAARAAPPFAGGRLRLEGPCPAETAFRDAQAGRVAGVVAMYHDQATVPSKLLDWGHAVNVTWGLPFVRTSVDHGVAYDAAARGDAQAEGMIAAVALARRLVAPTRGGV